MRKQYELFKNFNITHKEEYWLFTTIRRANLVVDKLVN